MHIYFHLYHTRKASITTYPTELWKYQNRVKFEVWFSSAWGTNKAENVEEDFKSCGLITRFPFSFVIRNYMTCPTYPCTSEVFLVDCITVRQLHVCCYVWLNKGHAPSSGFLIEFKAKRNKRQLQTVCGCWWWRLKALKEFIRNEIVFLKKLLVCFSVGLIFHNL